MRYVQVCLDAAVIAISVTDTASGFSSHRSALREERLTTDLQRARRDRILEAVVEIATTGDDKSVRIRDVATRAKVSLATVYHYFPSKVHLLVWALDRELAVFDDYVASDLATIAAPFARLRHVAMRLIDGVERSSRISHEMTHAYVASMVVAPVEAEMVRGQTSAMFVRLMSNGFPDSGCHRAADILTDVWTAEVLAMNQGRRTHDAMRSRLSTVIDILARSPRPPHQ